MTTKKAVLWLLFWMLTAAAFCGGICLFLGASKAVDFAGGYVLEMSLSLDNLFLFLVIFRGFGVDTHCQRRILTFGIAGVIVLRLIFILVGAAFVSRFHWILYIFGFILMITGVRVFLGREETEKDYRHSKMLRFFGKFIRFTDTLHGDRFFVKDKRLLYATPLFAILLLIEGSDILFAIDSVPAVFSITTDVFIVYTSNIFAVLGLRNLYFLLERASSAFRFVRHGVAVILIFTGIKLCLLIFHIEIGTVFSIGVIASILALCILASVLYARRVKAAAKRRKKIRRSANSRHPVG